VISFFCFSQLDCFNQHMHFLLLFCCLIVFFFVRRRLVQLGIHRPNLCTANLLFQMVLFDHQHPQIRTATVLRKQKVSGAETNTHHEKMNFREHVHPHTQSLGDKFTNKPRKFASFFVSWRRPLQSNHHTHNSTNMPASILT